ncbi:transposase [Streptomyces sp. NPDC001415]
MESTQRVYDAEFRGGAVRIVIETGRPIPEVAEELGVRSGTLHSWVSRWRRNSSASSDRPAPAAPGNPVKESERAELKRLRREMGEKNKRIRELGMERDVFKH